MWASTPRLHPHSAVSTPPQSHALRPPKRTAEAGAPLCRLAASLAAGLLQLHCPTPLHRPLPPRGARPKNTTTTTTTHRLQTLAPSRCRAAASSSPTSARAAPLSTSPAAAFRRTSPLLSSPGDKPAPTKVEDVMPRRSQGFLGVAASACLENMATSGLC
ncbi:uncharacterized protein [Miscanthus floridulus]|uniref:uncharacterized protein n=1 Tax=Miscanthus floridulus TaxID=154761 RepID=UPI00345A2B56